MKIIHTDSQALSHVLKVLEEDQVFIYPTDTLYGIGANALSFLALEKVYHIKERPSHMPMSMMVRDLAMLKEYAHVSTKVKDIVDKFLPGALTLILPAKSDELPQRLFSVEGYLGFRIPDHDFCRKMSKEFHFPIITTSVNVSGKPALNTIQDIEDAFADKIDLMIYDPQLDELKNDLGSTILKVNKDDSWEILREGKIPKEELIRHLH
jgi:L-threonylcarbamoyladenylate synthase